MQKQRIYGEGRFPGQSHHGRSYSFSESANFQASSKKYYNYNPSSGADAPPVRVQQRLNPYNEKPQMPSFGEQNHPRRIVTQQRKGDRTSSMYSRQSATHSKQNTLYPASYKPDMAPKAGCRAQQQCREQRTDKDRTQPRRSTTQYSSECDDVLAVPGRGANGFGAKAGQEQRVLRERRVEGNICSSFGFQSQSRFERMSAEKISNIDKINSKIKRILDTLNDEERKISEAHLRVGPKKASLHSYGGRIKTEGDELDCSRAREGKYGCSYGLRGNQVEAASRRGDTNNMAHNQRKSLWEQQSRDQGERGVYGRLIGIREKYQHNYWGEESRSRVKNEMGEKELTGLEEIKVRNAAAEKCRRISFAELLEDEESHFANDSKNQYRRLMRNFEQENESRYRLQAPRLSEEDGIQPLKQQKKITNPAGPNDMAYFTMQNCAGPVANTRADQTDSPFKILRVANSKSTDSLDFSPSLLHIHERKCSKEEQNNPKKAQGSANLANRKQHPGNDSESRNSTAQTQLNHKYDFSYQACDSSSASHLHQRRSNAAKLGDEESRQKISQNQQQLYYKFTQTINNPSEGLSFFGEYKSESLQRSRTPERACRQSQLKKQQQNRQENSCKLSNGKDVDRAIEKIQLKIDEFEEIKKQLHIEEEAESRQSRDKLAKSVSKYLQRRASSNNRNGQVSPSLRIARESAGDKRPQTTSVSCFEQHQRKSYLAASKKLQEPANGTDFEVSLPKPFKMSSKRNTKRNTQNSGVREIESAFISEERPGQSKSESQSELSIKQLISSICEQIELDTKFRNSKKWFSRRASPSKWSQLGAELKKKSILTSEQQNRDIFTMLEDEDNPFHTSRDDEQSYSRLIANFINSESHWIDNLQHRFSRQAIERGIHDMDIDRKGRVTIEDFVRYVNLESDKYYRNRDCSLVMRRLSGANNEVTPEYIIAEFCHQ